MSMDSPADLCRRLGFDTTPVQSTVMERLSVPRGLLDASLSFEEDQGDTLRAALMVVLWRTLLAPRSRSIILAPAREPARPSDPAPVECGDLGRVSMRFLKDAILGRDNFLTRLVLFPHWNRLVLEAGTGWEVRLVPNVPVVVAAAAEGSFTALILDAGRGQTALAGASEVLEERFDQRRGLLIRLW